MSPFYFYVTFTLGMLVIGFVFAYVAHQQNRKMKREHELRAAGRRAREASQCRG